MMNKYYTTSTTDSTNVTNVGEYPVDELANIMPLIHESIMLLATSIEKNGLRVPITTVDGKIVDGRCRAIACAMVGVDPRFDEVGPMGRKETYELVLDLNNRRNVTAAQKAMIAAMEVSENRHTLAGIPNAQKYAKAVWGINKNTYAAAKYVLTYGRSYAGQIKQTGFADVGGVSMSMNKLYEYLKKKTKTPDDEKPNDGSPEIAMGFKQVELMAESLNTTVTKKQIAYILTTVAKKLEEK